MVRDNKKRVDVTLRPVEKRPDIEKGKLKVILKTLLSDVEFFNSESLGE